MKKFLLSICLWLACPHGARAEASLEEGKKNWPDRALERQLRERAEKQRLAHDMQIRKYAEAQALLRVNADSDDCLAIHVQRGCLVKAQAFNRAVGSVEPDHGLGETPDKKRERIRFIRRELLKQMLQGEFLMDALKATGLEDEVVKRAKEAEAQKWAQAAKAVGEKRLRAIYDRYQDAFAARESRVYQVLASTDSLWIDSLSKLSPSAPSGDPQSHVPWVSVPDTLMPPELADTARSLKKTKSALTVSWKAGYACIRLASARRSPPISFEQALPTLVGLSPYRDPDSLQALQEAKDYYGAHPAEFRNPDTLVLDVALAPGEAAEAAGARHPRYIRLQSIDLPKQAGQWLTGSSAQPNAPSALPAARDSLRVGATLGPVFIGVGTWTFRIVRIRKGTGLTRFEEAKDGLEALLRRRRTAQALAEVREVTLDKSRALGMRIFEDLLNERQAPDEAELSRRMQADSSELVAMLPGNLPPERIQENLRVYALMNLAQARRDRNFESWLRESVTLEKIDPD